MTAAAEAAPTAPGAVDCPPGPHTHSAEEAAQLIGGVAPGTLRKRAKPSAGPNRVPSTKVGREVRFTDEDIAAIISGGSRQPTPPRRDSRRRS